MYETIVPKSTLLQKHLISIDLLRNTGNEFPLKYYAFPQKGNTIAILKNTKIIISENEIRFSKDTNEPLKVLFLGRYLNPLKLVYEEFVNEISLNFSETGIHYFFSESPNQIQTINLNKESDHFFSGSLEENIKNLEHYLVKSYRSLAIQGIEKAVQIINNDASVQTAGLAKQVFLTEKTLNRHFQKYVGCTVSNYRKIVRFRNTINDYFGDQSQSLTVLCHKNDYFDSPHFNKEIKKIAHFNPKDFFKKVTSNGRYAYPYIFQ